MFKCQETEFSRLEERFLKIDLKCNQANYQVESYYYTHVRTMCLCFRGQHFGYTYTTTSLKHAYRVLGKYIFYEFSIFVDFLTIPTWRQLTFSFLYKNFRKISQFVCLKVLLQLKNTGCSLDKEFTVGIMQMCKENIFSIRLIMFKGNNLLESLYYGP